jgi:hypothetical protein
MTETQKDLWKANLLEFLHNCLIGISHLECSEENCPLVLNWGGLEKKNSHQGKSALVKITSNYFAVVDLIAYQESDLGTYSDLEVKFKSGKTQRTKPTYENPQAEIKVSGTVPGKVEPAEEIFLKEAEVVCFFNNPERQADLEGAEEIYLEDLWDIKEKIKWDREKSKKKVFLFCENDPGEETQARKIDASEKDYLFYIADPGTTNEIKNYEVYAPSKGTEERRQLHEDFLKDFSELRRVYGIRHLTSKKEDRQNNPEIELNEAQFVALERDKWRERNQSIKEAESKGFCLGIHKLTYGAWQEREEAEVEQMKELEQAKDPIQELINQHEQEEAK